MAVKLSIRSTAFVGLAIAAATSTSAAAQQPGEDIKVEQLLKDGWQVAGFTNTFDNRSALILFRHPTETYLVQCRSGYDPTRKPPVYTNCYGVR